MRDRPTMLSCHVWVFHSDSESALNDAQASVLSRDEQNRAARYRDADRRQKFIVSRVGLREILAVYLNVEPAEVLLERLPSGKPIVTHPSERYQLPISISHTANSVCLAIASTESSVGVDIEQPHSLVFPQSLFHTVISDQERSLFGGLNEAAKQQLLLEIWTAKEATFKAIGCRDQRSMTDVVVGGQLGALRLLSAPSLVSEPQLAQFQVSRPTSAEEQNRACGETLCGSLVVAAMQPRRATETGVVANSFARVRENHNSIIDRMVRLRLECTLKEFLFGDATAPETIRSVFCTAGSSATAENSVGSS